MKEKRDFAEEALNDAERALLSAHAALVAAYGSAKRTGRLTTAQISAKILEQSEQLRVMVGQALDTLYAETPVE